MNNNAGSTNAPPRSRITKIGLQHLQYAVAAADHGSFRRAAEALLLRQSTLSRCIRQLEHLADMVVFERSSGGVRATEAGHNFLRLARSVLEQMDSLVATAHRTSRGEAGRITIGFYTSLSTGNLRATLVDTRKDSRESKSVWSRVPERDLLPPCAMER
jgi:DNA-binding transcriptional LysR family regulator